MSDSQTINSFSSSLPVRDPVRAISSGSFLNRFNALTAFVPETGDSQIDTLLGGIRWQGSTITYSFFSNGTSYYGDETASEVSPAVKNNVRFILQYVIAPYVDLEFVEVADSTNSYGTLRFMNSNGPGYAYAYFPSTNDLGGDVHLNPAYDNTSFGGFQQGAGSYGWETLIHEILHALGVKHPGNYFNGQEPGPYLPTNEDSNSNTVMSYHFAGQGAPTMMPYDIKTLQYIYGSENYNNGNTVYNFSTVSKFVDGATPNDGSIGQTKRTIFDSGGIDTIFAAFLPPKTLGYIFDIAEGGLITETSVLNAASYTHYSFGTGPFTTFSYGTRIAYNTIIENVVGTSSDDQISGNSVRNVLSGEGGNDIINGLGGNDVLYGGPGNDELNGGSGNDLLGGVDGDDTLRGGTGDDFYTVNSTADIVIENPSAGTDRIQSTISWTLGINFEQLKLINGFGNINGTGNGLDNRLFGNESNNTIRGLGGNDIAYGQTGNDSIFGGAGNDILVGEGGNDVLVGEGGNDILFGGAGNDEFVYRAIAGGVDSIRDFDVTRDRLNLQDLFDGLGYTGSDSIGDGYLRFAVASGTTFVQIDANGSVGGNGFVNLTRLIGFTDTANLQVGQNVLV